MCTERYTYNNILAFLIFSFSLHSTSFSSKISFYLSISPSLFPPLSFSLSLSPTRLNCISWSKHVSQLFEVNNYTFEASSGRQIYCRQIQCKQEFNTTARNTAVVCGLFYSLVFRGSSMLCRFSGLNPAYRVSFGPKETAGYYVLAVHLCHLQAGSSHKSLIWIYIPNIKITHTTNSINCNRRLNNNNTEQRKENGIYKIECLILITST